MKDEEITFRSVSDWFQSHGYVFVDPPKGKIPPPDWIDIPEPKVAVKWKMIKSIEAENHE